MNFAILVDRFTVHLPFRCILQWFAVCFDAVLCSNGLDGLHRLYVQWFLEIAANFSTGKLICLLLFSPPQHTRTSWCVCTQTFLWRVGLSSHVHMCTYKHTQTQTHKCRKQDCFGWINNIFQARGVSSYTQYRGTLPSTGSWAYFSPLPFSNITMHLCSAHWPKSYQYDTKFKCAILQIIYFLQLLKLRFLHKTSRETSSGWGKCSRNE